MLRTLIGFLCVCFSIPAQAKLGESEPQLMKRFGKSYTIESNAIGKTYRFRSEKVSVDALVANGVSVAETYFSDHPLTASGEPPNDIVRAVLKTNAPQARWVEIDAAPFRADYALQSSDHEYTAVLRYTGPQPEDAVWTMTVGRAKVVGSLSTATPPPPSPVTTPLATPAPTPAVSAAPAIIASPTVQKPYPPYDQSIPKQFMEPATKPSATQRSRALAPREVDAFIDTLKAFEAFSQKCPPFTCGKCNVERRKKEDALIAWGEKLAPESEEGDWAKDSDVGRLILDWLAFSSREQICYNRWPCDAKEKPRAARVPPLYGGGWTRDGEVGGLLRWWETYAHDLKKVLGTDAAPPETHTLTDS